MGGVSGELPLVVGIGGTTRASSSSERLLHASLRALASRGVRTELFDGPFLGRLPLYEPERPHRTDEQIALLEAVRRADGLVIASPGYHGGISGLVKNAIDLLEDTAKDERVYFDGMPVGLIVTAYGWQATGSTLAALRSVVHAMRGWPTPVGVAVNSKDMAFDDDGVCSDTSVNAQIDLMASQLDAFLGRSSEV
jgi:FMN reductase